MKTKGNAFYYGYTLVLIAAMIYEIICLSNPNCSFPIWNRIVLSATVSTCFFCISDIFSMKNDLADFEISQYNILSEREDSLIRKVKKQLEVALSEHGKKDDKMTEELLIHDFESAIESDKMFSDTTAKGSLAFCFNILGFLSFFAFLLFDRMYQLLFPFQEILTILAFIIVLCGSVYKEKKINKINKEVRQRMEKLKRMAVAASVIEIVQEGKKRHG